MALIINKFFSSRKKSFNKNQDISEKTFVFSKDQVRLVLFRECDFRGRKLLFDSQSVQRVSIPINSNKSQISNCGSASLNNSFCSQQTKNEVFVEITNGYGYQYLRPSNDIIQLGEMIFGSVAMSFRGTSLKIHSFNSPPKLMCTQVFPSPKHSVRGRISVSSQHFDPLRSNSSVQSFEKSAKFDQSSTSSNTSFNEGASAHSTESDFKISRLNGSVPLDVPMNNQSMLSTKMAPSLEGDSGFCGEQSYSSVSSGPPSISLWDSRLEHASVHGFSCGSLYKRWLRSASTSLDYNACSENSLTGGIHTSTSADEYMTRGPHRSSKLGLAVIIQLSEGQEVDLERFLLEHSALIESMVCRARSGAEVAYTKPGNFASLMYEVFKETSEWLTDLITGPTISSYLWHSLSQRFKSRPTNCDNKNNSDILVKPLSIKSSRNLSDINKTRSENNLLSNCDYRTKNNLVLTSSLLEIDNRSNFLDINLRKSVLRPNSEFLHNDYKSSKKCLSESSLNSERFVRELCELLETVDTKHTNFFISTLLTAVLTHHLGWVSTVLAPSETDKETISRLHAPCNPLWGQLSDLYGAVGSPTKIAHTIICGSTKGDIISKILYTLTYFIRCSVVERNSLSKHKIEEEILEMNCVRIENNEAAKSGLSRTKTCADNLQNFNNNSEEVFEKNVESSSNVIFVLGDNDQLVNLKQNETEIYNNPNIPSCSTERPKDLKIPLNNNKTFQYNSSNESSPDMVETLPCHHLSSSSETSPCSECDKNQRDLKISQLKFNLLASSSKLNPNNVVLNRSSVIETEFEEVRRRDDFNRSQSVPPSDKNQRKCSKNGCKKKYSGVKFDFKQYPQIVTNYMKSKNLEMSQMPFAEKALKMNRSFSTSFYDCSKIEFPSCDCEPHSEETLQTPSNASELEYTCELSTDNPKLKERKKSTSNNAIFEHDLNNIEQNSTTSIKNPEKISFIELPMPKIIKNTTNPDKPLQIGFTKSLLRGVSQKYISDLVLQGTISPFKNWEHILKRDLALSARKPILDQPVQEAVAIVANTDTWEVQLISSHTYIVEKNSSGIRLGMSQLVANMLETLLHMWKLRTPPEYCLMHIENRLREFCLRSKSLAELLMTTEFCNMDLLTSSMQLEINDVPLLMAVASTHTPQVTQKYGLSFQ